MNPAGGARLGVATAIIRLLVNQVTTAAQQLRRDGASAQAAIDSIGTSAEKVEKKTTTAFERMGDGILRTLDKYKQLQNQFDNTRLTKLTQGLDDLAMGWGKVGIAASAYSVAGLAAADSVQVLKGMFTALSGSAELGEKRLDDLRKLSDEMGVSFLDTAKSAQAILPAIGRNNVDLAQTVLLLQRLAILDPAQGLEGAAFAVRELMSGDVKSLAGRFELPRKALKELVDAADGDVQKIVDGLDGLVDNLGLTNEALKGMGNSLGRSMSRAQGAVTEAMAVAFTPLLNNFVIPAINLFASFVVELQKTAPELLQMGAAFAAVLAVGPPLLFMVSQIIKAYQALTMAVAASNGMMGRGIGLLGKVAGVGIAGALGGGLGLAASRGLADSGPKDRVWTGNQSDLQRIRSKEKGGGGEDAGAVLGERLKQGLVIILDFLTAKFLEFAKTVVRVNALVADAFDFLISGIRFLGTFLTEFGGNIQKVLGQILIALGQFVKSLPGQEAAGSSIISGGVRTLGAGAQQVQQAQQFRSELGERLARGIGISPEVEGAINAMFDGLEKTRGNAIMGIAEALGLLGDKAEEAEPKIEKVAAADPFAMNEDEMKQGEEIAESIKSLMDDIENIETGHKENLLSIETKFTDEQLKIVEDRVKAEGKSLEKLEKDRAKMKKSFDKQTIKDEQQFQKGEAQAEKQFREQQTADEQAHIQRVADIRRKALEREQELLLNFDFAGLFELQQETGNQVAEETRQAEESRALRQADFEHQKQERQTQYDEMRTERQLAFEEQLNERSIAHHEEMAQIADSAAERLLLAQKAHTADLEMAHAKYTKELEMRREAARKELEFLAMTEAQRTNFLLAEQRKYLLQASQLFRDLGVRSSQPVRSVQAAEEQRRVAEQVVNTTSQAAGAVANVIQTGADFISNLGSSLGSLFNPTSRAFGGTLMPGQTSWINDKYKGQVERAVLSSGQGFDLPGGAGLLIPSRRMNIESGGGGSSTRQLTVTIPIVINAPIDESILPLIEQAAEAGAMRVLEAI